MIEIDLKEKKQDKVLPVVAGLDLNLLDLKWVILALVFHYGAGSFLNGMWEKNRIEEENQNKNIKKQIARLKAKERQTGKQKAKIQDFLENEKQLNNRLNVVNEVTRLRKNPWKILHYVSVNIPKTVWINKMSFSGQVLSMEGETNDADSINTFIENLKNSIFFDEGQPELRDIFQKDDSEFQGTIFSFTIAGNIRRYE
jgi:Tfp pilus assembly protein PilN